MPREIEIKIKLNIQDLELLKSWLSNNARFIKDENHVEYYLNNPASTFYYTHKQGFKDSENYLRIRMNSKGDSICLKQFKIDQDKGTSENIGEFELSISDGKSMLMLMKQLGYTDIITLKKDREIFEYKDFEISIDNVNTLGYFAEFELKTEISGDIKQGLTIIKNLLKEIGFQEIDEQQRGYISMLWNKDKDFGKKYKL